MLNLESINLKCRKILEGHLAMGLPVVQGNPGPNVPNGDPSTGHDNSEPAVQQSAKAPEVAALDGESASSATLDAYLGSLVDVLMDQRGMDEEEAWDCIFTISSQLEDQNLFPPFPEYGGEKEVSVWLGSAFEHDLIGMCLRLGG